MPYTCNIPMMFSSVTLNLWSFFPLQPFWQVVNYSDSRGRGVVGENPCSPVCVIFECLGKFYLKLLRIGGNNLLILFRCSGSKLY